MSEPNKYRLIAPPVAVVDDASIEIPDPVLVSPATFSPFANTDTDPPAVDTDETSTEATVTSPPRDSSATKFGVAAPVAEATIWLAAPTMSCAASIPTVPATAPAVVLDAKASRLSVSVMAPEELVTKILPDEPAVDDVRTNPINILASEPEIDTAPEDPVRFDVTTCAGGGLPAANVKLIDDVAKPVLEASASITEPGRNVINPPVIIPPAVPAPVSVCPRLSTVNVKKESVLVPVVERFTSEPVVASPTVTTDICPPEPLFNPPAYIEDVRTCEPANTDADPATLFPEAYVATKPFVGISGSLQEPNVSVEPDIATTVPPLPVPDGFDKSIDAPGFGPPAEPATVIDEPITIAPAEFPLLDTVLTPPPIDNAPAATSPNGAAFPEEELLTAEPVSTMLAGEKTVAAAVPLPVSVVNVIAPPTTTGATNKLVGVAKLSTSAANELNVDNDPAGRT